MSGPRTERVFLVRMWCEDADRLDSNWRGSIHEVPGGRRFYLTAAAQVADFIGAALRRTPGAEPPAETSD